MEVVGTDLPELSGGGSEKDRVRAPTNEKRSYISFSIYLVLNSFKHIHLHTHRAIAATYVATYIAEMLAVSNVLLSSPCRVVTK